MKKFIAILACAVCLIGCDGFERNSFNTLASAKAVIDTAQADYESDALPHSQCVYTIVTSAKVADKVAVDAMLTYEGVKASKGDTTAAEAVVVSDLASLAPIVAQIQTLKTTNPNCGGK